MKLIWQSSQALKQLTTFIDVGATGAIIDSRAIGATDMLSAERDCRPDGVEASHCSDLTRERKSQRRYGLGARNSSSWIGRRCELDARLPGRLDSGAELANAAAGYLPLNLLEC